MQRPNIHMLSTNAELNHNMFLTAYQQLRQKRLQELKYKRVHRHAKHKQPWYYLTTGKSYNYETRKQSWGDHTGYFRTLSEAGEFTKKTTRKKLTKQDFTELYRESLLQEWYKTDPEPMQHETMFYEYEHVEWEKRKAKVLAKIENRLDKTKASYVIYTRTPDGEYEEIEFMRKRINHMHCYLDTHINRDLEKRRILFTKHKVGKSGYKIYRHGKLILVSSPKSNIYKVRFKVQFNNSPHSVNYYNRLVTDDTESKIATYKKAKSLFATNNVKNVEVSIGDKFAYALTAA